MRQKKRARTTHFASEEKAKRNYLKYTVVFIHHRPKIRANLADRLGDVTTRTGRAGLSNGATMSAGQLRHLIVAHHNRYAARALRVR